MDEQLNRVGRRERQIIDLLLQGCDNSEIAQDLNIAERTVKAHLGSIYKKLGVESRAAAVAFAVQRRLV